jgi:hypothetical protein
MTCGHFRSIEDSFSGRLHIVTGSAQFIVRKGRSTSHSGPLTTCTSQWYHLNRCSNTNAELTCSLVYVDIVEIATFVLEFDISSIILWEHVNLNAAYVLSSFEIISNQNVRRNGERRTSAPVTWPSTVYPWPRGIATNSSGQDIIYMLSEEVLI